ncbi:MAG: aminoglycoside phosphotransferase family protein, partial [Bacteroidales bacterium]|nr:aminoglycoside phosphotransferase family protein [Bacteroidales bacterium]
VSYEVADNEMVAREGGKAIGGFQSMLTSLGMDGIADTIPGFHDLASRLQQFEAGLNGAVPDRLKEAGQLIQLTRKFAPAMLDLYTTSVAMKLPVRLSHNDVKFNNILFSKEGNATCLIDLDTVMKGYAWFDFGDALRTCASTAPEDEGDPENIGFRMDIFRAFAEGFLSEAKHYLTADEVSLLHRAPAVFAFMQGVRFLTDFLNRDVYYRTRSANHNLVRATAQFTLMQRMLEEEESMAEIIRDASAGVGT